MTTIGLTSWAITQDAEDDVVTVTPMRARQLAPFELILFGGDGETPSRALWRVLHSREPLVWVDVGQT